MGNRANTWNKTRPPVHFGDPRPVLGRRHANTTPLELPLPPDLWQDADGVTSLPLILPSRLPSRAGCRPISPTSGAPGPAGCPACSCRCGSKRRPIGGQPFYFEVAPPWRQPLRQPAPPPRAATAAANLILFLVLGAAVDPRAAARPAQSAAGPRRPAGSDKAGQGGGARFARRAGSRSPTCRRPSAGSPASC